MDIEKRKIIEFEPFEEKISHLIKVIGVGGAGCNAVNYMFTRKKLDWVDYVVVNTDVQALHDSPVPVKIQLGKNLTGGLGAGSKPEIGKKAALEDLDEIENLLKEKTKMLFITAGMGGGTGTGAAPEIAKLAKKMGILTVGVVTMPFAYEGEKRRNAALEGIRMMRKYVDSLLIVNNEQLINVYGDLDYLSAFAKSDEVLSNAVESVTKVIMKNFQINVDFNDVKTVLKNSGTALIGTAVAQGDNRAEEVIKNALNSPLLNDNQITGAKDVLLLIVSGTKPATVKEIDFINKYVRKQARTEVNIIMGLGLDESLEDKLQVTVIATGFPPATQDEIIKKEEAPERVTVIAADDEKDAGPVTLELDIEDDGYDSTENDVEQDLKEKDDFPDFQEKTKAPKENIISLDADDFSWKNNTPAGQHSEFSNNDSWKELSLFDEEEFKVSQPVLDEDVSPKGISKSDETQTEVHKDDKEIIILDENFSDEDDMYLKRMEAMEEKDDKDVVQIINETNNQQITKKEPFNTLSVKELEALKKYKYKFKKVDIHFPEELQDSNRQTLITHYVVLKDGNMKLSDGNSYLDQKFD